MVKQNQKCVNEDFKGSNNTRGLFRRGTKGQTTLDVCYGVVQRVKQHQRFVTECYIVSNNIRCLLRSGTKGQPTQEVCYGVVQSVKHHQNLATGLCQRVKQRRRLFTECYIG